MLAGSCAFTCISTIWNVYCEVGTVKYENVTGYKKIITSLKEKASKACHEEEEEEVRRRRRRKYIYSKHSFSGHKKIIALRYFHETEEFFFF